jgi:lipopolysaccharide export LptBFGC system permease protein LptF
MGKKLTLEIVALIMMVSSLALVLITLSGQTRTYGLWIAGIAIFCQLLQIFLTASDSEKDS